MHLDLQFVHGCGGSFVHGGSGEYGHTYCDRCHAFVYDSSDDDSFPTGTNEEVNRQAWDDGEERSPDQD